MLRCAFATANQFQETLRLLEGIEMHKEDWKKVAEHVNFSLHHGNPIRSIDDCVLAFIRFSPARPRCM